MTIYKYVVSSHPDNWGEGSMFDSIADAREFMAQYGDHGAALTQVKFVHEEALLIDDTRPGGADAWWAEYCLSQQGNWVDPDAVCQDDTPPGWGEEGGL